MPRHYAIVPAAGSGARFGSEVPKQYLDLAGRPLIHHALAALCLCDWIDRVWVVLSPLDEWWAAYDVPRHLWHFTPSVMQQFGVKHGFKLAEQHPMPFDAFYVSMLTERYKGSRLSFLKGMWTGLLAWFSSLAKKERSSSMIYVFRKK